MENEKKDFVAPNQPPPPEPKNKNVTGVVAVVGDTQVAREFITVGRTFDDALGKTHLLDDNMLNDVILYKSQLMEFEMTDELEDLTSWLNGRPAIGGYNLLRALQAIIGIAVPHWGHVKYSSKDLDALKNARSIKHNEKITDEEKAE